MSGIHNAQRPYQPVFESRAETCSGGDGTRGIQATAGCPGRGAPRAACPMDGARERALEARRGIIPRWLCERVSRPTTGYCCESVGVCLVKGIVTIAAPTFAIGYLFILGLGAGYDAAMHFSMFAGG